jgi:acyl-CoA synthetase (AMP-forming)/AMP-acid ligase II
MPQAELTPELAVREAMRNVPGGRCVVLAEDRQRTEVPTAFLAESAEAVGRGLLRSGWSPGEHVVISAPNSLETLQLIYGAIAAGVIPVLVSPRAPVRELEKWREIVDARAVVANQAGSVRPGAFVEAALADSGPAELPDLRPDDCAACFTTSGSTAGPKLVALSHRSFAYGAINRRHAFASSPEDTQLMLSSMCHVTFIGCVHAALVAGQTLVLLPDFNAKAALSACESEQVTIFSANHTMYELLLREGSGPAPARWLRRIMAGGSVVTAERAAYLTEQFGCEVITGYGSTESGGTATWATPEELLATSGTAGRPLPGITGLRGGGPECARDPAAAQEIALAGPQLMLGYRTSAGIDTEDVADGWLRTGDLGFVDGEGLLHVLGKSKGQISRGGLKVSEHEVEQALRGRLGITDAAVLGIPDPVLGERVVAVIEADADVSVELVRNALAAELAAYKLPEKIVRVPRLPRTAYFKVDKEAIRQWPW